MNKLGADSIKEPASYSLIWNSQLKAMKKESQWTDNRETVEVSECPDLLRESTLDRRLVQVVAGCALKSMRKEENFGIAEDLAGKV